MVTLAPEIRLSPLALADAYKESHSDQYPSDVTMVYSNLTPRKSRVPGMDRFVFFGLQYVLLEMNEKFKKDFFDLPKEEALNDFKSFYRRFFSSDNEALYSRVERLHELGYLPIEINALPEGTLVQHGIPVLTIHNTSSPEFYWVTNFLETYLSCELWHSCTSATTAFYYRLNFDKYAEETSDLDWFVDFQGHDFSMRGQTSWISAAKSGAGHILSFKGSDTCPVQWFIDKYYGFNLDPDYMIATSVPATEHSVVCAGGKEGELETLRRLFKVYPKGILSFVSDTWDFWRLITEYLPILKDEIMAREGTLVVRPDSSPKTPVEIIVGDSEAPEGSPENKGLIQCLYEIFGGTKNSKGFIQLDSHIGAIYGDSITLEYQEKILEELKKKGFASTNIVLGIGSYSYQMVSRDTHGIAIKATAIGKGWDDTFKVYPIFKDPKTDNSGKKSAKGLLKVIFNEETFDYELVEGTEWDDCYDLENELALLYRNGELSCPANISDIRENLNDHKENYKEQRLATV